MIGGKVDELAPERRREAVLDAAFVLSDRNQLLRSHATDHVAHCFYPICEYVLGKKKEVIDPQRVVADVYAAWRELDFFGKRNGWLHVAGGKIPSVGQHGPIGIAFVQPVVPCFEFDRIAIRSHCPQMLRDAGFVDEVPGKPWNIMETCAHGRD